MIENLEITQFRDFPDNRVNDNQVLAEKINELIKQSNRQELLLDLMAKQVMKNLTE